MPELNPFGQSQKSPQGLKMTQSLKIALLSLCTLTLTACATTQTQAPSTQRGPVAERPAVPDLPIPTDIETPTNPETETKRPEDVVENDQDPDDFQSPQVQDGPYFNNREGLTPPHMAGRDTKRLALLLPFSTSSTRLAQEAQSMYRAAELAVFARPSTDVLLIALDTKGTEEGARSATCLLYTSDAADD